MEKPSRTSGSGARSRGKASKRSLESKVASWVPGVAAVALAFVIVMLATLNYRNSYRVASAASREQEARSRPQIQTPDGLGSTTAPQIPVSAAQEGLTAQEGGQAGLLAAVANPVVSNAGGSEAKQGPGETLPVSPLDEYAHKAAGGVWPRMLGSRLFDPHQVERFSSKWECLLSEEGGQWVLNSAPRLLPWPTAQSGLCSMVRGFFSGQRVSSSGQPAEVATIVRDHHWAEVSPSAKYVWARPAATNPESSSPACRSYWSWAASSHPAGQALFAFDGDKLCGALLRRNATVFIVGDTVSYAFYKSLLLQLQVAGKHVETLPPVKRCEGIRGDKVDRCEASLVCGATLSEGVLVHWVTSAFLARVRGSAPEQDEIFKARMPQPEMPWGDEAVRAAFPLILMNRGSRLVDQADWVKRGLNYSIPQLRARLPNGLLIYRSTPTAHTGCNNVTQPLLAPLKSPEAPVYWDLLRDQNAFAKDQIERIGGIFFDVQPMTELRADGHIGGADCLHYCSPSPIDEWVRAFSVMLTDIL